MSESKSMIDSVVGNFFYGEVEESSVFPFPHFTEHQEEFGKEMVNAVNKFCEDNINGEKMDHEAKIPEEVIKGLAELGDRKSVV